MTLEEGIAGARARAKWLRVLLMLCIAIDAIAILSNLSQYKLLSRAAGGVSVTSAEAAANDARHGMIGVFQVLAFAATACCWLIWFHRAYSNLRLMGTKRTNFTPTWALGCWFVPVVNLFRPYQITKELWLRGARGNSVESIKGSASPTIVVWWWLLNLVTGFLGHVLMQWSPRAKGISAFQGITITGVVLNVVGIVSAILAIAVVRNIDRQQQDANSGLVAGTMTSATTARGQQKSEEAVQTNILAASRKNTKLVWLNRFFMLGSVVVALVLVYQLQRLQSFGTQTEQLLEALSADNYEWAEQCARSGANVNFAVLGRPLIFHSIREGDAQAVAILLRYGAEVNGRTALGRTPLHEAALYGRKDIVQVLLDAGADVNAHNTRGETPLFYAEDGLAFGPPRTMDHAAVAKLLRTHGGTK